MLPEWRRKQLMAVSSQFLKETCTIEQQTLTTGEYGEEVAQWTVVTANAKCRLIRAARQSGSAVQEAGGQETMEHQYRLIVGIDVNVDKNQRVTVGGDVYDIVRVETKLTDELFRTVIVVRR